MSVYSSVYRRVLLPFHNKIRHRQYTKFASFLGRSQWWPRDQLLEFQWKELLCLLKWAYQSVPYYQEKYRTAGIRFDDIRTREDFAKLPVLTRSEINDNRERMCSIAYRGKLLPHATGGSSGSPTRFYRTIESYDWRTAAKDRVYSWCGWTPGERSLYLWGAPVGEVPLSKRIKVKAFESFHRQLVINTFSQTEQLWTDIYHHILRYRPSLIVGYVSSLAQFATFLKDRRLEIPCLKGVIGAAEPIYSAIRDHIQEGFHSPVFNTYGSREFMSIAGECSHHTGLHINSENIYLETMSNDEDASELLVTDLHNYGMPFIRYAIGDLASLDYSSCACGRGLPKIRTLEGRVLDSLQMPDGRRIPGEFFPHLLKDIPEVRRYQVKQETLNVVVISAVLSRPLSPGSQALLKSEVLKVLGPSVRCEIKEVPEITLLASGKHRVTVGLT